MNRLRLNALLMLFIAIFGGYIAYTGSQPITIIANAPSLPSIKSPPKQPVISINYREDKIEVKDVENASIDIQTIEKTKPVIKWKTRTVEKTVVLDNQPAPYRITPLVKEKSVVSHKITKPLPLIVK